MTGAIGTIDKPYNWKYTPLVLVGIFIIFCGSFSAYYYILRKNGIYSIAVVTGFKNIGAKGDECTSFYFYYKGTKY